MMKPLNILSIDWDYFVNATEEQRIMDFPDSNDNLSQELGKFLWNILIGSFSIPGRLASTIQSYMYL